jgi:molecular chaperone DnaK (HSP70)
VNGRLAIDFGTSTTLLAMWDDAQHQARILPAPEYGRFYTAPGGDVSAIPSLIHYASDRRQWVGEQVAQLGLAESARTFRWMKRYIANRSPVTRRIDDGDISHARAGADFLGSVLVYAAGELGLRDEEIALTVPVEAFEHYENWLLARPRRQFSRCRLIDEASAAALGYGAGVSAGQALLVFDFGGGTLDVSVALLDEAAEGGPRRCRVLGKAGADLGGASVDQWLYEDVVRRNGRDPSDPLIRRNGRRLLAQCEALKIALSTQSSARLTLADDETGLALAADYTRVDFEALLEQRGFRSRLDRVMRRALNSARERGYDEDRIGAALMVGGGSLMPVAQSVVRQIFGQERVRLDRSPMRFRLRLAWRCPITSSTATRCAM